MGVSVAILLVAVLPVRYMIDCEENVSIQLSVCSCPDSPYSGACSPVRQVSEYGWLLRHSPQNNIAVLANNKLMLDNAAAQRDMFRNVILALLSGLIASLLTKRFSKRG